MPSAEQLRTYAELAITVGLGLEPNDRVLIEIPTALPDLAHDLVDVAYERGAEDVEVLWVDTVVDRSRFVHGQASASGTVATRSRFKALAFDRGASNLRVLRRQRLMGLHTLSDGTDERRGSVPHQKAAPKGGPVLVLSRDGRI